jgi:hypothetical protein
VLLQSIDREANLFPQPAVTTFVIGQFSMTFIAEVGWIDGEGHWYSPIGKAI